MTHLVDEIPGIAWVFGAYLCMIPTFGALYYWLYAREPRGNLFLFQEDIIQGRRAEISNRHAEDLAAAESRIARLTPFVEYGDAVAAENASGRLRCESDALGDETRLQLSDGRTVVLRRTVLPPLAGGQEFISEPTAFLISAAGKCIGAEILLSRTGHDGSPIGYFLAATKQLRSDREKDRALALRVSMEPSPRAVWRFIDFLYFSTITQATVGYGDILPNSSLVRTLVACQVLSGYFLLVVAAGLALQSRVPCSQ